MKRNVGKFFVYKEKVCGKYESSENCGLEKTDCQARGLGVGQCGNELCRDMDKIGIQVAKPCAGNRQWREKRQCHKRYGKGYEQWGCRGDEEGGQQEIIRGLIGIIQ